MNLNSPSRPAALYPDQYTWLVFLAAMDVLVTALVLAVGGIEANLVAQIVLHHLGLPGMVIFKFALTGLVICICEMVGRRNLRAGRLLAFAAVMVTAIPVATGFILLLARTVFNFA